MKLLLYSLDLHLGGIFPEGVSCFEHVEIERVDGKERV